MNLPFIGDIIAGLGKAIDPLVTSDKERLELQVKLKEAENDLQKQVLQAQSAVVAETASVLKAEMSGESAKQREWRPDLMYIFMKILIFNYIAFPVLRIVLAVFKVQLSLPDLPIPPEMWSLLTLSVSGYVGGRSLEKITDNLKSVIRK